MNILRRLRDHHLFIQILLWGLIIFFGLQTLSRAALSLGSRFRSDSLHLAAGALNPLDGKGLLAYGRNRLRPLAEGEPAITTADPRRTAAVQEAISALKTAVYRNILDYQAHFYLGSAYLSLPNISNDALRRGIDSLHRAIRLKGGKDIVMNTRTVFYSLEHWRKLNNQDRRLAGKQLRKIIARLPHHTFEEILKRWEVNCRDIDIFESDNILAEAPRFYKTVADSLARLQTHEAIRRVYMLNHEIYSLNDVRGDFRKLKPNSPGLMKNLQALHARLHQDITGYHKLTPGSQFKSGNYQDISQRINFHILHQFFAHNDWKSNPDKRLELIRFVEHTIGELPGDALPEFQHFLEEQDFWQINLLHVHYLRNWIEFKIRDYPAVIRNVENLKLTVISAQTPEEEKEQAHRLMLLLTDAYIASRLYTRAAALISEIETIFPENQDLWVRYIRVQQIMGEDKDKKAALDLQKRMQLLRNSTHITLKNPQQETTIYLLDDNTLEISCSGPLTAKLKRFHLFQVSVNGEIRFEKYINDLRFPVSVKITPFQQFSPHQVTIGLKRIKEIGDERRKKIVNR